MSLTKQESDRNSERGGAGGDGKLEAELEALLEQDGIGTGAATLVARPSPSDVVSKLIWEAATQHFQKHCDPRKFYSCSGANLLHSSAERLGRVVPGTAAAASGSLQLEVDPEVWGALSDEDRVAAQAVLAEMRSSPEPAVASLGFGFDALESEPSSRAPSVSAPGPNETPLVFRVIKHRPRDLRLVQGAAGGLDRFDIAIAAYPCLEHGRDMLRIPLKSSAHAAGDELWSLPTTLSLEDLRESVMEWTPRAKLEFTCSHLPADMKTESHAAMVQQLVDEGAFPSAIASDENVSAIKTLVVHHARSEQEAN